MEPSIVNLLAALIRGTSDYLLARLEFATSHLDHPTPPLLTRLPDASARALRDSWPRTDREIIAILAYMARLGADTRPGLRDDPSRAELERTVGWLDRHARALRWALAAGRKPPHDGVG